MSPRLFIFEGPDGVGKTSLANRLFQYLTSQGQTAEVLSFPGREAGTVGELVYRLYHNPRNFGIDDITITAEQLLFTAAHADVIERRILPALAHSKHVILDRYWWSTWVYATVGNLNQSLRDRLLAVEHSIWGPTKPTTIFLLRRKQSLKPEVLPEKWARLVALYREIGDREKKTTRVVEIHNDGAIAEAEQRVLEEIRKYLR